jgi:hypothetical protein
MILIGTDDGIYRWFDGCGWPIFHSLQGREIMAIHSPGAGLLAAVDREGRVWESINNGQTWRTLPLPDGAGKPSAVAVSGSTGTLVVATRPLGLISRPVGAPVPRSEEESPARQRHRLVRAIGATMRTIRAARPRGQRAATGWTLLRVPHIEGVADPSIRTLTLETAASGAWLATIPGAGLWRSEDRGTTWTQCPGLPPLVNTVRMSPQKPGTLCAATSSGCWVSVDEGQTWEERSGGLERARYLCAVDVKPDQPDVLMAGAAPREPGAASTAHEDGLGFALYESTNGGRTWSVVRRGIPESFAHDAITDVRFDPAAPDSLVVALASGELWVSRNTGAYFGPLARQIHAARVLCAVG